MLVIQKFPKPIAARTKCSGGPHAGRVFGTSATAVLTSTTNNQIPSIKSGTW